MNLFAAHQSFARSAGVTRFFSRIAVAMMSISVYRASLSETNGLQDNQDEHIERNRIRRRRIIALLALCVSILVISVILIPIMLSLYTHSRPGKSHEVANQTEPRFISGANMKELLNMSSSEALQQLAGAKVLGLDYVRIFLPDPDLDFEPTNLNSVLESASKLDLSVLIVLLDNWGATFDLFLDSSPTIPPRSWQKPLIEGADNTTEADKQLEKARHALFWSDAVAKDLYKSRVMKLLVRNASASDEQQHNLGSHPAILGFDLVNEPRCEVTGCNDIFQSWLEEMAPFARSLMARDKALLVGSEGFFGPSTPSLADCCNPGPWASLTGQDYFRNNAIKEIDTASLHFWPDNWNVSLSFSKLWLDSHLSVTSQAPDLNKPVVLEEFGKKTQEIQIRDESLQSIYDLIIEEKRKEDASRLTFLGSFVWELGSEEGSTGYEVKPSHNSSRSIIKSAADLLSI